MGIAVFRLQDNVDVKSDLNSYTTYIISEIPMKHDAVAVLRSELVSMSIISRICLQLLEGS